MFLSLAAAMLASAGRLVRLIRMRGWLLVLLNLNQSTSVVELIRAWISVFTPMVFAVLVELLLSHVSVHPVPLVVNVMAEL